jgi:hypothetical protein
MNTGPDAEQAVPHETPSAATSPFANPGTYTARLTAGGKTLTQTFTLKMDPRVKTSTADLLSQFTLSKQLYDGMLAATAALDEIAARPKDPKLQALAGGGGGFGGGRGGGGGAPTLNSVRGQLQRVMRSVQGSDVAPTTAQRAAATKVRADLDALLKQWAALKAQ